MGGSRIFLTGVQASSASDSCLGGAGSGASPENAWNGVALRILLSKTAQTPRKSNQTLYEETYTSCQEIKRAKPMLVFKRYDGCSSDYTCYIYVSDNILSAKNCPCTTLQQLVLFKPELLSCTNEE
jgi:hypothetical protein